MKCRPVYFHLFWSDKTLYIIILRKRHWWVAETQNKSPSRPKNTKEPVKNDQLNNSSQVQEREWWFEIVEMWEMMKFLDCLHHHLSIVVKGKHEKKIKQTLNICLNYKLIVFDKIYRLAYFKERLNDQIFVNQVSKQVFKVTIWSFTCKWIYFI